MRDPYALRSLYPQIEGARRVDAEPRGELGTHGMTRSPSVKNTRATCRRSRSGVIEMHKNVRAAFFLCRGPELGLLVADAFSGSRAG